MSNKLPIVAIVGRANVGKSSLFNAVLERREAIVAQEAGTTRDSITAKAEYKGQHFWIVDTAGIKDPEDEFEFTIQEQISQAADSADLILVVIEANVDITDEDRRVAKMALKTRKPVFLVINKSDKVQASKINERLKHFERLGVKDIVTTSTTQRQGIDDLLDLLVKTIPRAVLKETKDKIGLALLGRPNVGKSSLFNTLAKKQQAIVADRAGTTRDVNRTPIKYQGKEIELMDTAGIRRSGKIGQGIERFSVIRSLAAIEQADICVLLIDAGEIHAALDQKIAGMVKEAGKGLIIAVSKWDVLDKDAFTRDQLAPQIAHDFDFVPWAPLVFTSSQTGQNAVKIFELALSIYEQRHKQIKTSELNRWLERTVASHPPAGLKNRQPKLNYIIQEDDNPTNFKIYGSQTKFLHWSYKRFLEKELRQTFGFNGTAIKFWFFEKRESHKHGQSPTRVRNKQIRYQTQS